MKRSVLNFWFDWNMLRYEVELWMLICDICYVRCFVEIVMLRKKSYDSCVDIFVNVRYLIVVL